VVAELLVSSSSGSDDGGGGNLDYRVISLRALRGLVSINEKTDNCTAD